MHGAFTDEPDEDTVRTRRTMLAALAAVDSN